jgi:hypothetical protein
MVHWYVQYNGHELTIHVSFMVNFGSNGFMTKMQPFPMDGHYRRNVNSGMGHLRLDSVMPLMLSTVCCAMANASAL